MTFLRGRRQETAERFARLPLRLSFTAGLVWTILDLRSEARIARLEEELRTAAEGDDLGFEALRGHQRLHSADRTAGSVSGLRGQSANAVSAVLHS